MNTENDDLKNSTNLKDMTNDELLNEGIGFENFFNIKLLKKIGNIILDVVFGMVVFILMTNVGFSMFYEVSQISGGSMKPTFNEYATDKFDVLNEVAVYKNIKDYNRGDVIIYNRGGTYVIKRIVAMEGDRIKIDYDTITNQYRVFLNGKVLEEPYLAPEYSSMNQIKVKFEALYYDNKFDCAKYFDNEGYMVIPQGYFFYIGDNRTGSSDCTEYGPQPIDGLKGKVFYKYQSGDSDDMIKMLGIKIKVLYGNMFNSLEPNF